MGLFIKGGFWLVGLATGGWVLSEATDTADAAAKLAKWAVIGGGVYIAYGTLKTSGAIK